MTYLETLSTAIAAHWSGTLIEGTNLFLELLPAEAPDFSVVLYRYPGSPPLNNMRNPLVIKKPRMQVYVRSANIEDAMSWCEQIVAYLVSIKGISGTSETLMISPVSSPAGIGRDPEGLQEVTCNLEVWHNVTSANVPVTLP